MSLDRKGIIIFPRMEIKLFSKSEMAKFQILSEFFLRKNWRRNRFYFFFLFCKNRNIVGKREKSRRVPSCEIYNSLHVTFRHAFDNFQSTRIYYIRVSKLLCVYTCWRSCLRKCNGMYATQTAELESKVTPMP